MCLAVQVRVTSWMITKLNEATAMYHADADSDFDILFDKALDIRRYMQFLLKAYGFEMPVEGMLAQCPRLALQIDLRSRARSGYLVSDLFSLGMRPVEIAELPQCLAVPQFRHPADALGWMYVTERATLAHSVVLRHLRTRLPGRIDRASAYLGAYNGTVGAKWRELGESLQRIATDDEMVERIVSAAGEAFRTQRRWMMQDIRPAPLRIVG